MLLRNYDNLKAMANTCFVSGKTRYFQSSTVFEDGHISFKTFAGYMSTYNYVGSTLVEPLHIFYQSNGDAYSAGNSTGDACLICGYEENEVTYDDYKIDNLASGLKFVEHSVSTAQLNENNEIVSTYTKILCNTSNADITINCIGATYYNLLGWSQGSGLVYKEKIPDITIAPKQNVVLTFTTKVPMGQNKPADYSASASV